MTGRVVVHVGPHPDDELIGAPAALFALRDAGWRVVALACSLGAPDEADRRYLELQEACSRAGFEMLVPDPDLDLSTLSLAADSERRIAEMVERAIDHLEPRIVVSPSPGDGHPAHIAVGRTVARVLRTRRAVMTWWMWGLWADLPHPNVIVPFDEPRLREIISALESHAGELDRNDYRRLLQGRAMMNAILGPERVFGFGAQGMKAAYAELITEVVTEGDAWSQAAPRVLSSSADLPHAHDPNSTEGTAWLRDLT